MYGHRFRNGSIVTGDGVIVVDDVEVVSVDAVVVKVGEVDEEIVASVEVVIGTRVTGDEVTVGVVLVEVVLFVVVVVVLSVVVEVVLFVVVVVVLFVVVVVMSETGSCLKYGNLN